MSAHHNPGVWSLIIELLSGALIGVLGSFLRWTSPENRRFSWALLYELPAAALLGSAGFALAAMLDLNGYGQFLFAFMFGYVGQAALTDLANAARIRAGLKAVEKDQNKP